MLRYLFAGLIDEEIKRDEAYRSQLLETRQSTGIFRLNAPQHGELPPTDTVGWPKQNDDDESAITPRPVNGLHPMTPGMAIGVATPGPGALNATTGQGNLPSTAEEGTDLKKTGTNDARNSGDYFSNTNSSQPNTATNGKATDEASDGQPEGPQSPTEPEKDSKSRSLFGKKNFRMKMPNMKLGRTSVEAKPIVAEEPTKEAESDKSSEKEEKVVEDNFYGIIQKIRNDYDENLLSHPDKPLASGVTPSLSNETPVLRPPSFTTIIIQEDAPEAGGVADLYRGSVSCVGQDADLIEKSAPMWLGDLLLRVYSLHRLLFVVCSCSNRIKYHSKILLRYHSSFNHSKTYSQA